MLNALQRLFAPAPKNTPVSSAMSAAECQALRQLLLLTQKEAGTWIGKVSERSWQYWESDQRPVPKDVSTLLRAIVRERCQLVDAVIAQLDSGAPPVGVWYQSEDDWKLRSAPSDKPWDWKLHNSVIAELAGRERLTLVRFSASAFHAWSKQAGRKPVMAVAEASEHLAWAVAHVGAMGEGI